MPIAFRSLWRIAVLLLLLLSSPAQAFEPDEVLKDPVLESRARAISAHLRCPVCQNQSIDDSNAPLSKDLRLLVRERLLAGDSDAQVKQFLVARYGEFILLKPPLAAATIVLWIAPLLLLGAAAVVVLRWAGRSSQSPVLADAPLTAEEQARLTEVLGDATAVSKKR
jgi:cytochrome c-type biogenesis protein CcmH